MKSLRYSAVWIKERWWLCGQRVFHHRVSASSDLSCPPETNDSTISSPLIISANRTHDSQRTIPYIRTALGVGAGFLIGATIKAIYDSISKPNELFQGIPSVCAASPFSVVVPSDTQDQPSQPLPPVSKRQIYNFIADAVEKVSDKVVYIDIKDSRRRYGGKRIQTISNGSGFIVSEDGLILTNAHVVTNRPRSSMVVVRLQNGKEYEGIVEDIDALSDLALIRIKCFGNSGGPLINMDGEVIGINCMTVTSGISFAIPIDYAKEFITKSAKKKSEIESSYSDRRRYLGVTMLTLTQSILLELQARGSAPQNVPADVTHGIFIWRIVIGSPAYQAGLQPGDIITHINNHEIHSSRDVYKFLEGKGDLTMTVIRNGQRYSVTVVPEE
ncbi:hypothetical protein OTU49_004986 [Cherax quadricarinatus]|uniref:PDZ domain-containing protein n=1 Tax=Cherax quadricarinatus TaxID=27406 RepID=A0AAW0XEC8_CHEQU